jgi:hypothetical protein
LKLSLEQTQELWALNTSSSFLSNIGISKWYRADFFNNIYDDLKIALKLSDFQMQTIISWLEYFRETIVNSILIHQSNINYYSIGKSLSSICIFTGIVLIVSIALLGLMFLRRKR